MTYSRQFLRDKTQELLSKTPDLGTAGSTKEAIQIYQEILKNSPKNTLVMAHYAPALQQIGNITGSIAVFRGTLALDPNHLGAHLGLAASLERLGELKEAANVLERAIELSPTDFLLHISKAKILLRLGHGDAAQHNLDIAFQLKPKDLEVNFYYGKLLFDQKKFDAALIHFQFVRTLRIDWAPIYFCIGNTLYALNRLEEALHHYEQATQYDPNFVDAYTNKGIAFLDRGFVSEAIVSLNKALVLDPDLIESYLNLGNAYGAQGDLIQALKHYDHAIILNSKYIDAYNSRGATLQEYGQYAQALACYEEALRIAPNHADTQWNKALCALLLGDFENGLPLYESGWLNGLRGVKRYVEKPLWLGEESIIGKTLLIYAEQGLGDTLMFMRYALVLEKMGATVMLEVPESLYAIAQTLPFKRKTSVLIKTGAACPDYDYQCPLMSLPLALKTRINSIPTQVAYVYADSLQIKQWNTRLKKMSSLRVGIAWSGRPDHRQDRRRSIALAELAPLLTLPIEWHSLQKEYRTSDYPALEKIDPILQDHSYELEDLSDTAALIHHLDLVISVDTAVAHLAAAMGKPTWILIANSPDFRWLLDRPDSPWYPSVRLIRQRTRDNWLPSINELKELLTILIFEKLGK